MVVSEIKLVKPHSMLTFLSLVARLPLPLLHVFGALLGLLALLRGRHRRLIADNLRHAGLYSPGMVMKAGMETGKMLLELPAIWLRPLNEVTGWVREVRGWEHVDAALHQGKGLIFVGPHLGCWELSGLYPASRMPIIALYRRPRQDWFHELMQRGRGRTAGRAVEPNLSGVRAMLKALKHNEAAWILIDQHASEGDGNWMPFFDRWAYMTTLAYRLHEKTRAPMLMFHCERLPWGRGYRLNIDTLPELPDDALAASRIVNRIMEERIRRQPEQYLWTYRLHRAGSEPPPEGAAR
jgi:KDO2-lipid IV(A) lauroyltransferase